MSLIRGALFHCFYFIAFTLVSSHSNGENKVYRKPIVKVEEGDEATQVAYNSKPMGSNYYYSNLNINTTKEDMKYYKKGATFSPRNLLTLAMRLGELVKNEKGGFVSSSRSPEELADRLFYAFFRPENRFIKLKDKDLATLRRLQTLNEIKRGDIKSVDDEVVKLYKENVDEKLTNIESLDEYFNRIIRLQNGASKDSDEMNEPKPDDVDKNSHDEIDNDVPPTIIDLNPNSKTE